MSDEATDAELQRIETKIIELAEAYLISGRPYLLSKLGIDLGEDLRKLKSLTSESLAQFISNRLANRFSVALTGQHNNIQALVRAVEANIAPETIESLVRTHREGPRYNYRFWAAFSVPLQRKYRFLNMNDLTFHDGDSRPDGGDYIEVEAEFIAPEVADERDKLISSNIQSWLAKRELPANRFYAKSRGEIEGSQGSAGRSLLELMVEALDRRQLSNVNLPLDVVAELMKKRV
jgi:hypothetical protein